MVGCFQAGSWFLSGAEVKTLGGLVEASHDDLMVLQIFAREFIFPDCSLVYFGKRPVLLLFLPCGRASPPLVLPPPETPVVRPVRPSVSFSSSERRPSVGVGVCRLSSSELIGVGEAGHDLFLFFFFFFLLFVLW